MSERPPPGSDPVRVRLERQLQQAGADIEAVREQMETGELDEETGARLEAGYRQEAANLRSRIDDLPDPEPAAPAGAPAVALSGRRFVGALVLIGAVVAVVVFAGSAIRPRHEGSVPAPDAAPVDLDSVTNEQLEAVIAANPDNPEIAGMRVALANRYFEEGDFSPAVEHYLTALAGTLPADRRAQALGRIGWMTYLSGETDTAERYLEEALTTEPDYGEGQFFYALLLLDGRQEPCRALPLLEAVAARQDIPGTVRAEVESALARAQAGCSD